MDSTKRTRAHPVEILVAEDSPTQAERLRHLLEEQGHRVRSVPNGRQALATARQEKPALILSDIVMPEMDGYTLCKEIKSDPGLKEVPVVLLTALQGPEEVVKALECGADNFLRKPYDEPYLVARIEAILANQELRSHDRVSLGVRVDLGGRRYFITADRQQILDLLLSSFLEAIRANKELEQRTAELAAANQQLELRNREIERASKFKDQFLSTMSHELRTPLNAILGFSELLSDESHGLLDERQRRFVGHIQSGGKHLLKLTNDILDLSRIEAGRLQLEIETVPVASSLGEVLSVLCPLANKKSQTVTAEAQRNLSVAADATRFKQILLNLLGNAIKFTPDGGRITLAAHPDDSHVRIEVRDTGPGIPAGEQKRIFEAFYRLTQPGPAPEGTGLGLAITQRLVELQGGELGLESELGRGSCFYFRLPAAVHTRSAPAKA